jgi:hypothetical protein
VVLVIQQFLPENSVRYISLYVKPNFLRVQIYLACTCNQRKNSNAFSSECLIPKFITKPSLQNIEYSLYQVLWKSITTRISHGKNPSKTHHANNPAFTFYMVHVEKIYKNRMSPFYKLYIL